MTGVANGTRSKEGMLPIAAKFLSSSLFIRLYSSSDLEAGVEGIPAEFW